MLSFDVDAESPILAEDEQRRDLKRGLRALADLGIEPHGYRAPYWRLARPTLDLLGCYGILYYSSLSFPRADRLADLVPRDFERGA